MHDPLTDSTIRLLICSYIHVCTIFEDIGLTKDIDYLIHLLGIVSLPLVRCTFCLSFYDLSSQKVAVFFNVLRDCNVHVFLLWVILYNFRLGQTPIF